MAVARVTRVISASKKGFQDAVDEAGFEALLLAKLEELATLFGDIDDTAVARATAVTEYLGHLRPAYLRTGLAIIEDFGLWDGCATLSDLNPFFNDPVGNAQLFIDIADECGFNEGAFELTLIFTTLSGVLPQALLFDGPSDPEADPPYLSFNVHVPTPAPSRAPAPPPSQSPAPAPSVEKDAAAGETVSTLPPGANVIVIDDASTEPEVGGVLEGCPHSWQLHRHRRNCGFVATANHGMRLAGADDVSGVNQMSVPACASGEAHTPKARAAAPEKIWIPDLYVLFMGMEDSDLLDLDELQKSPALTRRLALCVCVRMTDSPRSKVPMRVTFSCRAFATNECREIVTHNLSPTAARAPCPPG